MVAAGGGVAAGGIGLAGDPDGLWCCHSAPALVAADVRTVDVALRSHGRATATPEGENGSVHDNRRSEMGREAERTFSSRSDKKGEDVAVVQPVTSPQ